MRWMGALVVMAAFAAAEEYPGAWVETWEGQKDMCCGAAGVKAAPFRKAVVSWNADLSRGGVVEVSLQAGVGGRWLPAQVMGRWKEGQGGTSVKRDGAQGVSVDVDTLVLAEGTKADRFRYRIATEGSPLIRMIAVATWDPSDRAPFEAKASPAWGKTIDVPERSQMSEDASIRGDICSPTSLSMVLEHFGVKRPTAEVARGVYDGEAKIYGNWPLNTAYAGTLGMRVTYVARFRGLEDLEHEVAEGRPVIISHQWKEGELTGAPVASSKGHLVVVVGFTDKGDVVINDPAAHLDKGEKVRRVYPRREIYHTWLENGQGVAYIVRK